MAELIVTKGLPGSGKTLWSKKWVDRDPKNRIRLHRGEVRNLLGFKWNRNTKRQHLENIATAGMEAMVIHALENGLSVVIDGMNLHYHYRQQWRAVAEKAGAEFWTEDFMSTPWEEILAHNNAQPEDRRYPEHRLRAMYLRHQPRVEDEVAA